MSEIVLSKKYRDVCPDTVQRVYAQERAQHKNEKEADKAARAHLHQITGAFMSPEEVREAEKLLSAYQMGDDRALMRVLRLHSSTRERLEGAQELYARIFALSGQPERVLDLACGLNPLLLGSMDLKAYGLDISGSCVRLVNAWAQALKWDVKAVCGDLLCHPAMESADLALLMKLLPVLEQQKKGSAMPLLDEIPARTLAVTFPLRTLGGRKVGMEKHYSDWFEAALPQSMQILGRLIAADELCYVVRRNEDAHAVCGGDADRQSE